MAELCGHPFDGASRILDFGCGTGSLVYQFRDAGFDACGFDIHNYLSLRRSGDRQFFQIADKGGDTSDFTFDWAQYRLPYAGDTFDFVVSSQTLEHVLDLDTVFREITRVMKPDGLAIHSFPSRYRTLEAHTYVPFGGMTRSYWYNLLWTAVGVRNEFTAGWGARKTARRYAEYAMTGTRYPTIRELRAVAARYYGRHNFRPDLWHISQGTSGWRLWKPALWTYTLFQQVVWVLEGPVKTHDP